MVVHACNPSCAGSINRNIGLNTKVHIFKKYLTKKMTGVVTQVVEHPPSPQAQGPEFKTPYYKKKGGGGVFKSTSNNSAYIR
jgi:hypothetical protein